MIFTIVLIVIVILLIVLYIGAQKSSTNFEIAFNDAKNKIIKLRKEFVSDKHNKQEKLGIKYLCVNKLDKIIYGKKK
jgi:hypothetical protein